jgi:phospholipase C
MKQRLLAACSAALLGASIAGCASPPSAAGGAAAPALPPSAVSLRRASASPIQHVVIIFQENRSFDNIFAGFPGADAPMFGYTKGHKRVALKPIGFDTDDVCHGFGDGVNDWDNGKMDGFASNCSSSGRQAGLETYSYLRRDLVAPYWHMAEQYTLADRMFPTMFGPSFTAHLDIIAGTTDLNPTHAIADLPSSSPWGCDAPGGTSSPVIDSHRNENWNGPFPCYTTFRTMADTLDAAHLSWRFYAPSLQNAGQLWSSFDAIKHVRYGPDWTNNVVTPPPAILTDVPAGKLGAVTWVIPDWNYADHARTGDLGPSWVTAVVNAIGQSQYWNNTAIVVMWDDWGGWYDDAPPPQLDFRGLGLRVGCIIISPYARAHYVSHTQYEFGSVLRFIEDNFGLPQLGTVAQGYSDARATSIVDSFDFTQSPRAFTPFTAPYPPSTFTGMRPSHRAPDDE